MSEEIWDPGLQSERTRLAWVRTGVVMSTVGLGAAGLSVRAGYPPAAAASFAPAVLCGAVLLARTGARFRRYQRALHDGRPLEAGADVLIAWLGTLSVVLGAVFFVLF
ncbi:DUF202 domain-containing protein [Nonomuraea longicatena]|uniref:DUF202 domain-containing protein n=1 Tax=Nonomuraea longicatena TaxID=83682 RepID=A0ABN1NN66_9ACTN